MQFEKEKEQKVTINLSKEEIKEKYEDKLQPEIEGPIYDVLSKLFKVLVKVNILIPGEFKSAKGDEAIKCSVKASDGHLYPLKSSLLFIHKPVYYVKLTEIKYVEFSRIGGLGAGMPSSRSFDMTVTKLSDDSTITFAGIDKQEHKNLISYLKQKGVKTRSVDVETNRELSADEGEDDDNDDESQKGKKKGASGGARRRQQEQEYDDEDDEDDESFKDDGSGAGSGGEEGGEDEEDEDDEYGEDEGSDVVMDEDVDKDELKAL